ncbi:MAG TPA: SGNH/GDSL hydrolase family protein [Candidatus Atribacteria bacterium]|nr:SGNH/GDSL hydrolase family protein [Candidatus Atribacteria bacterium]
MKKRKLIINITAVCLLIISLLLLQRLLMPKYVSAIVEGSLIEEYYQETTGHDVIFVGDCEVYESFSPITLWENYGITSYIRGSTQQLIWQSYYLLEETLQYEKPEVVVFNVLAMKYDKPQKEEYNRLTLDGMRLSPIKIKAIQASMTEKENLIDYIFPILRYHSRWDELTAEDFQYMFKKKKLFHNGYYMRVDVRPVTTVPEGRKLANYRFGDNAYYYLDKMVDLCRDNDIDLVLVKAPSLYPYWYDEWEAQIEEYAAKHDLLYINFLELIDEIGIDFNTDTYDGGLHMNLSGAEKLSVYLGKVLAENYGLKDHRNDDVYKEVWEEKVDFYYDMKAQQYYELEKYGYLKSFGAKPPTS